jgi:hypothetical protein
MEQTVMALVMATGMGMGIATNVIERIINRGSI